MLSVGEKVFIITRRLFEKDLRRHFFGEILAVSGATIRVRGYVFIFNESTNDFVRREKPRDRIFPLIDAGIVLIVLPEATILEDIRYSIDENNQRIASDKKALKINVSEFGANR